MSKYVSFFSYTAETWGKMIEHPGDRTAAIRATVEAAGGTMESLYWMTGAHDGMLILDAPDSTTAAAIMAAVISSGALRTVETHELFTQDQLTAVLGKASSVRSAYRAPGT